MSRVPISCPQAHTGDRLQPPRILLIDDNALDVELTLCALAELGLEDETAVTWDGRDALDYLHATGNHAGRAPGLPCLVLLDLNMPRVNGPELLALIRQDAQLRGLYVVMLTTSNSPDDRERCRAANRYVVKPDDLFSFVELLTEIVGTLSARSEGSAPGSDQGDSVA